MTLRKLALRVDGLPISSNTWRAVRGGPHLPESDILADVFDVLATANWQRSGDNRAPRPKPYPRPGDDRRIQEAQDRLRSQAMLFRQLHAERQRQLQGGDA